MAELRDWDITDSGTEFAVRAALGPADSVYLEMLSAFDVRLDLGTSKMLVWKRQQVEVDSGFVTFRTGGMHSVEK